MSYCLPHLYVTGTNYECGHQIVSIHSYRKRILPILEKKLRSFYEILGSKTKLRQFLRNKGVCLGDCKVYGS